MKLITKYLKLYFHSPYLKKELSLSFFPFLFLLTIFYSNNLHLVIFDNTVLNLIFRLSILCYLWILLWRKFGKSLFIYLPLGLVLGIVSLTVITDIPNKKIYIWIFAFLFNFIFYKFVKIHRVLYIFLFFIFISQIFQGIYNREKRLQVSEDLLKTFDRTKYNQPIQNKLNVYYLLADGYSSFQTLKTQDRIDNSKFEQLLTDRGFSTNENAFSNYPRTYTSLQSTFQMKHHYYDGLHNINSTEMPISKYVIGGFNPVMSRFYNNGYSVYIIPYKTSEELKLKQKYKKWNGSVDKRADVEAQKQDIYWFLQYLDRIIIPNYPGSYFSEITESNIETLPLVQLNQINSTYDSTNKFIFSNAVLNIKDPNPKFIYVHNSTLVNSDICLNKTTKDYHYRKGLIDQLKCVNDDIIKSVDYIIKEDPNSIIILQADHGCCPQKNAYGDGSGMVKKNWFTEEYIEKGSEIQKKFGILLSVRWPQECKYLGQEKYTPVNLFPRIFACLNGKKPDYQKMEKDDAFFIGGWYYSGKKETYEVFKVIENNEILPNL